MLRTSIRAVVAGRTPPLPQAGVRTGSFLQHEYAHEIHTRVLLYICMKDTANKGAALERVRCDTSMLDTSANLSNKKGCSSTRERDDHPFILYAYVFTLRGQETKM